MAKKKKKREPRSAKPRFAPVHGSHYTQKDADYICPILIREYAAHNGLTTEDVKEMIRSKRHPLHRYEKTDEEMIERYRLIQASDMLRSFEVVFYVQHRGEEPVEHRTKFLHYIKQGQDDDIGPEDEDVSFPQVRPKSSKKPAGRNCYVTAVAIMENPRYQQQLVERAKMELLSFRNRYAKAKELINFKSKLGQVFAAIERLYGSA